MTDRSKWKPLTPPYKAALRAYDRESRGRLLDRDARDAITAPLYHYTDARGLEGIITAQQVWFTHYQHLNDPSEMEFGLGRREPYRCRRTRSSPAATRNRKSSRPFGYPP